jgi:hypothetical protein
LEYFVMPSIVSLPLFTALSLAATYAAVVLTATTYRLMRYGNAQSPEPWPFRFAFGYAAVEAFMKSPITQHRTRMRAMRAAEARRATMLAQSMVRHPAGGAARQVVADETHADFVATARATYIADQVVASFAAAKDRHPAARAARLGSAVVG